MKDYHYMSFTSAYIDEAYIWTVNDIDGGLYRINRKDYTIRFMICAVKEKRESSTEYAKTVGIGNKIYFFPYAIARDIIIYDKVNNKIEYIKFPESLRKLNVGFPEIIVDHFNVYLFSGKLHIPIIHFNIENNKFNCINLGYDHKIKKIVRNKGPYYAGIAFVENSAWIPVYGTSIIVEKNLANKKFQIHSFSQYGYKFGTISYDGTAFWIALLNHYGVISWFPDNDTVKLYLNKSENNKIENFTGYSKIICYNNKVFLLPSKTVKLEVIDKQAEAIYPVNDGPIDFNIIQGRKIKFNYYGYQVINNYVMLFPAAGSRLIILDTDTLKISSHELCVINDELLYKQYYSNSEVVAYENPKEYVYSLKCFCDLLNLSCPQKKIVDSKEIGMKIFNNILNGL